MPRNHRREDPETFDPTLPPSRSQQRRNALAVLALAKRLVETPPSRLARIDLPDAVREEIASCHATRSHIAHKRELGFLAKLLRGLDADELAPVREALGENRERQLRENATLHRLEALREELLAGDAAMETLIAAHPGIDRQHLRALVRRARAERAQPGLPARAYREIFRLLQELEAERPASSSGVG